MDKIIKIFKAEIKSINVDKKRAVVVVSTDKKDGDGDIVMPDAFSKRLRRYKDHPILLSSHNYYDLRKQIGMSHSLTINEKDVESDFEWFDGKGNPEADWGWFLAQKGVAAFSIGFRGVNFDWIEEKDDKGNKQITGRKFTEIELLEISQVLVPSNAGALQNSINDPSTPVEAKEMAELVLKSAKDWKINFEDFSGKSNKKDDNQNIELEKRFSALEKTISEIKESQERIELSISEIEPKQSSEHYSRKLLGDRGIDPKDAPDNNRTAEAEAEAIREAFKI